MNTCERCEKQFEQALTFYSSENCAFIGRGKHYGVFYEVCDDYQSKARINMWKRVLTICDDCMYKLLNIEAVSIISTNRPYIKDDLQYFSDKIVKGRLEHYKNIVKEIEEVLIERENKENSNSLATTSITEPSKNYSFVDLVKEHFKDDDKFDIDDYLDYEKYDFGSFLEISIKFLLPTSNLLLTLADEIRELNKNFSTINGESLIRINQDFQIFEYKDYFIIYHYKLSKNNFRDEDDYFNTISFWGKYKDKKDFYNEHIKVYKMSEFNHDTFCIDNNISDLNFIFELYKIVNKKIHEPEEVSFTIKMSTFKDSKPKIEEEK